MNTFRTSQFSYCPLVWMFHSRTLNNRINKLHEKALRLVYKNKIFLFWWLIKKGQINEHSPKESTNTYDRDLQWNIYKADTIGAKKCLRFIEIFSKIVWRQIKVIRSLSYYLPYRGFGFIEIPLYNTKNDLGPEIMKDTFHFKRKPNNLKIDPELQRRRNWTVYFGTESISPPLATKMWELIPSDIRNASSPEICIEKIKFWTTDNYSCRLCKTYIDNVGFI